ncbi:hypothetical protein OG594_45080 [Streptomyces sp. NBC_01214]|uniref:hypothetical protein n=1 Tax=Streptomyces sp. NBC_01214 TaxID=2903777 RepID=UPI002250E841|nr:hypothetical protein [Streptomyces sp. NBC_01214]MCX4808664.1 hypothetical protein [Streptomyces sp. NBC_01214]
MGQQSGAWWRNDLAALLFGPHGIEGLTRIRPDVYSADEELFQALLPPLTADVLSYYLPYQSDRPA